MCELARSTHKNQSYFYILAINHWKLKLGGWGRRGAAHVSYDSSETNEIGLNLIKHVQDLKTMKHWRRKSKSTDISGQTCSWIGRLNIVIKISFLHKLICRFNIIPESQQSVFFFFFKRPDDSKIDMESQVNQTEEWWRIGFQGRGNSNVKRECGGQGCVKGKGDEEGFWECGLMSLITARLWAVACSLQATSRSPCL